MDPDDYLSLRTIRIFDGNDLKLIKEICVDSYPFYPIKDNNLPVTSIIQYKHCIYYFKRIY